MVLMMKGKTDFAHIFAAITNISVVDRYLTVTRPLHVRYVRYSPSNTQALDILAFWGRVKLKKVMVRLPRVSPTSIFMQEYP